MLLPILSVIIGLCFLLWSADRFIDGSASLANRLGMSPLLIGIVIIGFGTSAPEMIVSAFSALNNNPGIALGNAYGSNITNIALILGITAIIKPILVQSIVLKKEFPILIAVTLLSAYLIYDAEISLLDSILLLVIFAIYMIWTIYQGTKKTITDPAEHGLDDELSEHTTMTLKQSLIWMILGILILLASSKLLIWGAVEIATYFGVSDLIIGLTVVAVGTSLPELASSIIAARKGEADLAVGNIIGSNLFNTLAVVGIAGTIMPISVEPEIFSRDMLIMLVLTILLFVFGYSFKNKVGSINRLEGIFFLLSYIGYNSYLIYSVIN